jgi:hypothetical protein
LKPKAQVILPGPCGQAPKDPNIPDLPPTCTGMPGIDCIRH